MVVSAQLIHTFGVHEAHYLWRPDHMAANVRAWPVETSDESLRDGLRIMCVHEWRGV
jgi:hypothetical protein